MPAQLGINGFDRIEMLMFRATSAKPGVIMVTVHDPPFRLLDHMVQHSSTPHHHECWLLDVKRLSTPHLLQCLVTSPRLLEANLILVVNKAFVFLEFAASSLVQGLWCRTMRLFLTQVAAYEG